MISMFFLFHRKVAKTAEVFTREERKELIKQCLFFLLLFKPLNLLCASAASIYSKSRSGWPSVSRMNVALPSTLRQMAISNKNDVLR